MQRSLAAIFFGLDASRGYLIAGGVGLVLTDLINRPTEDLDFFTAAPVTSVAPAREALIAAVTSSGYEVAVIQAGDSFARLLVSGRQGHVLIDLAIDAPPVSPPVATMIGPSYAPMELAARKVLALFGRAEARDFADVYVLVERFGAEALLREAAALDAGFDRVVFAQMLATIERFADDEVPLPEGAVQGARRFFWAWREQLTP